MRLEYIGVSCDVDIYTTKVAKKARERAWGLDIFDNVRTL